jgi:hypothetical protein
MLGCALFPESQRASATLGRGGGRGGGDGDGASALTQKSGAVRFGKWPSAHAGNVSEAILKQDIANIQQCRFVISVATIGQPEPGRPGSRRASAGTTRRFQPVLTHRSLEDASHEPSRGLTVVVVLKTRATPTLVPVVGVHR